MTLGGGTYSATKDGIRLLVRSVGHITALSEEGCDYLVEQFEWEKLDAPASEKKCQVNVAYYLGDQKFQSSRKARYPNLERLGEMPYKFCTTTPKQKPPAYPCASHAISSRTFLIG